MHRFVPTALAALLVSPGLPASEDRRLSPPELVAAAPARAWLPIAASDLLVMDLAPDASGRARRVVIQLLPPPWSQGWIGNIRRLAAARWWDGTSINRVQDNYVVQWGDADAESRAKAKPLPAGLATVAQGAYSVPGPVAPQRSLEPFFYPPNTADRRVGFEGGFPVAGEGVGARARRWPVHCYGTVGVGRNLPPDTGSGAELYAVIGHAPRHLDRNIAVVGRVIEGMEHLSALPRGTGPLGFYETAAERVPIASIRIGVEVPDLPAFEYLATDSESFARYAGARANRRDSFFVEPAGGADICNLPVPVRRAR